ncbi:MAG: hypothetical protein ACI4TY_00120 [Candidatus Limosilactobacillus intestinavium]|jgi:hypothetical protein
MTTKMNKQRIFLMMATLLLRSFVTPLAEALMNNALLPKQVTSGNTIIVR